jgi:cytochrome c biogenesis protein CcmG, thiol:disulfide interchange protein DsbE
MKSYLRFFLPLLVFVGIALFLFRGLAIDPRKVPSPLVGKPAPSFALPELRDPTRTVSNADLLGQVSLLNVWATWCVSCRAEHKELMRLAREDGLQIIGLNYKDERNDALQWLRQYGDPYRMNAFDQDGRVGIDWGVYGTPETFVVDRKGIIRYKQIGPISREEWEATLRPLVQQLKVES